MQFIIPKGPITIGTILEVRCRDKLLFQPGKTSAEVICRVRDDGQREIASLDRTPIEECYPGESK